MCFTFFTATCFGSFIWNHLQAELLKMYCIHLIMLSIVYNTFLKTQPEDGSVETSRNM